MSRLPPRTAWCRGDNPILSGTLTDCVSGADRNFFSDVISPNLAACQKYWCVDGEMVELQNRREVQFTLCRHQLLSPSSTGLMSMITDRGLMDCLLISASAESGAAAVTVAACLCTSPLLLHTRAL